MRRFSLTHLFLDILGKKPFGGRPNAGHQRTGAGTRVTLTVTPQRRRQLAVRQRMMTVIEPMMMVKRVLLILWQTVAAETVACRRNTGTAIAVRKTHIVRTVGVAPRTGHGKLSVRGGRRGHLCADREVAGGRGRCGRRRGGQPEF